MNETLTAQEAADYLRMSYVTLEQWRKKGIGPQWHRIGERKVIYYRTDLDAWIKQPKEKNNGN